VRAFIAIALPDSILDELKRQQASFHSARSWPSTASDEIRWTRPEGIHLTLKFLGEISEEQARKVIDALSTLDRFEKFWVEVKGFGFFPDDRRPRVFWAGLEAPLGLAELAGKVGDAMGSLGFPRETQPFTPHLTLARFKTPRRQPELRALVGREAHRSLGRFEVSEFFLYESKLSPRGAEYRKVARVPRP